MKHNQQKSPDTKDELKVTTNLNPEFDNPLSNPETFLKHISEITKADEPICFNSILNELLQQITPIDYESLAFPQKESLIAKLKLIEKSILNPDGNINMEALDIERDNRKEIKKELDSLKLNNKHLLILSIENILRIAEENNWGICKNHNFIYLYNGAYWSSIDKEFFQKFLGEAAEKMGVSKYNARFFTFREQLFKQFIATAYLPAPESPKDVVIINLKNGTFEVGQNVKKIRPFDKSDFLTYQLPFEYNPCATAPMFQAYLNKVVPDEQKQKILSEYLGSVFIRNGNSSIKLEKALILFGTGANGKSVFFEVSNALLGSQNVSSFSIQQLTDANGYFRAELANKLVNYVSEGSGIFDSSLLKQLISGEPVGARLPYGNPFTLTNYGKLIFNCNELPKVLENNHAYYRRLLLVLFDITIPEAEQDKELHTKIIQNELSGVFNWVLEGLQRLLAQKGFSNCDAVYKAIDLYKKQSDSVLLFIEENEYEKCADNYILIKELYKEYKDFCIEDNYRPVGKSKFIKRLISLEILTERKNSGNVAYLAKTDNYSKIDIPF